MGLIEHQLEQESVSEEGVPVGKPGCMHVCVQRYTFKQTDLVQNSRQKILWRQHLLEMTKDSFIVGHLKGQTHSSRKILAGQLYMIWSCVGFEKYLVISMKSARVLRSCFWFVIRDGVRQGRDEVHAQKSALPRLRTCGKARPETNSTSLLESLGRHGCSQPILSHSTFLK